MCLSLFWLTSDFLFALRIPSQRLRLPPPDWSEQELQALEMQIMDRGGVPVRMLGSMALLDSSSRSRSAIKSDIAGPDATNDICAICLDRCAHQICTQISVVHDSGYLHLATHGSLEQQGKACWLRELPCGHCFHPRCVCSWLLTERHCPLCRFDILSNSAS